ncbi:MAG TPA: tRNA uridine-5-carboxymethylaminomethyl(34) synthesis GTPase MnmE [Candidatus Pullichristensenella excrementigallinarum]|uniref:tRNA modification GTPase MnmE n=1 Tax=Candidatus Pullichristensenella excrementigallinarum TaxID=2840907 RepID=A0A9D1LCM5_9FIRM|nr:tRNA uridine-5-carboxymethylaminomethyl(34) synthesis GTPase MnmE [Candidatus Pullichristensenella excrementigallinarum]
MSGEDTIAAISTATGEGGIAIVRMSGDRAEEILGKIFSPASGRKVLENRKLVLGTCMADGEEIDEVMAVLMRAPKSYTREDVAEIHCHGGRACALRVLNQALREGARPAEPGEFTRRAFLNGRIDLSRAEAVMQLIGAKNELAQKMAMRQLRGGSAEFVEGIRKRLVDLLSLIEASMDFPEEVEEEAAAEEIRGEIEKILPDLEKKSEARRARLLREGAWVVLAGTPNAGKSSLMNALLSQDRAIVTEIPGTTRDVLTEQISFGGVPAQISDTAGLRDTQDPVEKIGVSRARDAVEKADVVVMVVDGSRPLSREDREILSRPDPRRIVCLNKSDLPQIVSAEDLGSETIVLSARTGEGISLLAGEIAKMLSTEAGEEDLLLTQRQISLCRQAIQNLQGALRAIAEGFSLDAVAVDLHQALEDLCEITGENASESVIDAVFKNFCVGK